MKLFVPGEEDAAAAWELMRQACGAPDDTRPIFSIAYEDEGTEEVATVGEEGVIAIIFGGAFYIFEGPEDWKSVPCWASIDDSGLWLASRRGGCERSEGVADRRIPARRASSRWMGTS